MFGSLIQGVANKDCICSDCTVGKQLRVIARWESNLGMHF